MLNLRKYLSSLTKEELIEEINSLSKQFKQVKDYYQARLEPHQSEDILAVYKEKVRQEFFTRSGSPGPLRLKEARKVVRDFAKIQANITYLIDLQLFYVEQGVKFTNSFGDIDEPFYSSVESMFEEVLKLIKKHRLKNIFKDRASKVVQATEYINWGFGDQMDYLYKYYY